MNEPELVEVFGQEVVWVCKAELVHGLIDCGENSEATMRPVFHLHTIGGNGLCECAFETPEPDTSKGDEFYSGVSTDLNLGEAFTSHQFDQSKRFKKARRQAEVARVGEAPPVQAKKAPTAKKAPAKPSTKGRKGPIHYINDLFAWVPGMEKRRMTTKRKGPSTAISDYLTYFLGWMAFSVGIPWAVIAVVAAKNGVSLPIGWLGLIAIVIYTVVQINRLINDWKDARAKKRNTRNRARNNINP